MSNFKYGASCIEVMYKKLEHPTDNLKDTRLFICRQAKNRQAKNKILFHARGAAQFPTLFHLQVKQRWELSSEPRAGNNILFLACLFLACFKEIDRFGINSSSLTVRPTEFVSKERHITDMSCNRKKIIEP